MKSPNRRRNPKLVCDYTSASVVNFHNSESIKKNHSDYSLNWFNDYIFDHHIFILVELKYLKGNQSFFDYPFIQNTYCQKSCFLDRPYLLLDFFFFMVVECKRHFPSPIACLGMSNSKLLHCPLPKYYDNL